MPTIYMIDAHNSVLGSSKINDTVNIPAGYTETRSMRGSFPVSVPFDVPIDGNPTDLNDLITKKYAATLSLYPGYSNILFDEQTDSDGWVTPTGLRGLAIGSRQTTYMLANRSSFLTSNSVTLVSTPSVAIFRWEAFEMLYTDASGLTSTRLYREASPASWNVSVTLNGASTWIPVTSGVPFNVSLANQGTSFQVRFNRASIATPAKVFLGSWALIY